MKYAVIGLGFGDEGKGTVVDYLCSKIKTPLVVRYCGGPQAGHTVYKDDIRHIFSSFGAGTLRGAHTYWSGNCPISPIRLINEYKVLSKKSITPKLFIDLNCPIITPYDVVQNKYLERKNNHGSCMIGFGTTKDREEKGIKLHYSDIFDNNKFNKKLIAIANFYNIISRKDIVNELIFFTNCIKKIHKFDSYSFDIHNYENIIYESSQGLLLDKDLGFFPYVTRDNVGLKNIKHEIINETYLVTRAYQTRHGNGPMSNELKTHSIKSNKYESNIYNKNQGEFRISMLDIDLLKNALDSEKYIRKNSKNITLVITCIDCLLDCYQLTRNDAIETYYDRNEFCEKIGKYLNINNILINDSPYSDTMKGIN